jgi:hypothetical protein
MTRFGVRGLTFAGTAIAAALIVQPAIAARSTQLPPGGVYTCAWIAAHPAEAAAASVSCSPQAPPVIPDASETTSIRLNPLLPDSTEYCGTIPAGGGKVGKGVWAWTPEYHYSNYWDIAALTANPYYTWYIQKVDGTNVYNQTVTDSAIHSHSLASNNYRGGAQNHSTTAANWSICHVNPG